AGALTAARTAARGRRAAAAKRPAPGSAQSSAGGPAALKRRWSVPGNKRPDEGRRVAHKQAARRQDGFFGKSALILGPRRFSTQRYRPPKRFVRGWRAARACRRSNSANGEAFRHPRVCWTAMNPTTGKEESV